MKYRVLFSVLLFIICYNAGYSSDRTTDTRGDLDTSIASTITDSHRQAIESLIKNLGLVEMWKRSFESLLHENDQVSEKTQKVLKDGIMEINSGKATKDLVDVYVQYIPEKEAKELAEFYERPVIKKLISAYTENSSSADKNEIADRVIQDITKGNIDANAMSKEELKSYLTQSLAADRKKKTEKVVQELTTKEMLDLVIASFNSKPIELITRAQRSKESNQVFKQYFESVVEAYYDESSKERMKALGLSKPRPYDPMFDSKYWKIRDDLLVIVQKLADDNGKNLLFTKNALFKINDASSSQAETILNQMYQDRQEIGAWSVLFASKADLYNVKAIYANNNKLWLPALKKKGKKNGKYKSIMNFQGADIRAVNNTVGHMCGFQFNMDIEYPVKLVLVSSTPVKFQQICTEYMLLLAATGVKVGKNGVVMKRENVEVVTPNVKKEKM